MRLPYTDNPPKNLSQQDEEVLKRVLVRRGEKGLIPLDLTLLHSPNVTDGWNSLLGAIRTRTALPAAIREIAICRPALINEAWFEWNAHAPILLAADGFTEAKLSVVQQLHPKSQGDLSDQEWAVLVYADEMTRNVKVSEETFGKLRSVGFGEKDVVEITATVASYNMVSRFLVALDVGEQNGLKPDWAGKS
ncbi:uncharacterized protein AB675_946 [Cyphellophora attinorum]|uniref:Carboxymuconolactone decarboxylase-like domain-containing protein n=1 Tax=Cyphellophora attinorum TaxID=1664694 RepID=A0A0N0NS44_9EURO|nr:uncharacterized protein AB675_946 [Phialophora attinorum]KPI45828.1 hypothetical protein AB675_946 [Phialophora attinorum]